MLTKESALRSILVHGIITGSLSCSDISLEKYNIRFPFAYNTLLLVRLDNIKSIVRTDIGCILGGIADAGEELLTAAEMTAYSTVCGGKHDIVLLVNHGSAQLDEEYIIRLQQYVWDVFGITVSAAYDTKNNDTGLLPEMYDNAVYAAQYRLTRGHGSRISFKSIAQAVKFPREYPDKLINNVLRQINSRSREGTQAAINEFIDAVSDMPYSYITAYASMLSAAISYLDHSKSFADNVSHDGQYIISQEIARIETMDELCEMLTQKCSGAIMRASEKDLTDKHLMLARSIEAYINRHCSDPNLSIDMIASHVNKSANYARSIFKQHIGMSISNYITYKRFEIVKRLLTETNLKVKAIAQMAGMNPGSYFYTAFKNYTGFTPEQYRNHYKKEI